MNPSGLALEHPAKDILLKYAHEGCPVNTGKPWTIEMMEMMIEQGPHVSALDEAAMNQLQQEVQTKEKIGQCKIVRWDDIKDNPPPQLKISPIAMIPHKSRLFRAILDLSFSLKLQDGGYIPSVNESSVKTAPKGAIDQMGHTLARIIHAMAQADEDAKVFMAKWDIKDGFWRLNGQEGEEWNFCYVLPQKEGEPVKLVVPTSLQMGWIESPPYFCAASETGRDVAQQYAEAPVGSLDNHKFIAHSLQGEDYNKFQGDEGINKLRYLLDVYVDDYISLAIPRTKEDLRHIANAVMKGVHDIFPADEVPENDALSYKKLLKREAMWALTKDILGFTFDGDNKTIWLEEDKRKQLLDTLHQWIRHAKKYKNRGIPFSDFQSTIAKLRHAFISIPSGLGLLSPCNGAIRVEPKFVYLQRNKHLLQAIEDCRTLLKISTAAPTKCSQLVASWPDYIGVVDASGHGVGGAIFGENKACPPTIFRFQWPEDITNAIVSDSNPEGTITNSDLECAGLLILFIVMEDVCNIQSGDHVALFSDNSPTVYWARKMASKSSIIAGQLIRALALRLKVSGASPLSTLHVAGDANAMTDIPSRSFGVPTKWYCPKDSHLLTLYNREFPLQTQPSWNVYQINTKISSRIVSVLRMQHTSMDEWRRLPKPGAHMCAVGASLPKLWQWTLCYRVPNSKTKSETSLRSRRRSEMVDSVVNHAKLELQRLVALSQPLAKRVQWPMA